MASMIFKNVYINDQETIVGPYENNGLINFNNVIKDFYDNEKSFENCEIKMQRNVFDNLRYILLFILFMIFSKKAFNFFTKNIVKIPQKTEYNRQTLPLRFKMLLL